MNKTNIEWVRNPDGSQGFTWNPISGCLNGCPYCYARKLANGRLKSRYLANHNVTPIDTEEPLTVEQAGELQTRLNDPFYPRFWQSRLNDPLKHKKSAGIFPVDMGEWQADWVPIEWSHAIIGVIVACPQHRFYLLTHQPQLLNRFSPFPQNCWVGGTVPNNDMWRKVIMNLGYYTKAKVKYISFEPLLERIMLPPLPFSMINGTKLIDWVIIGAMTGKRHQVFELYHNGYSHLTPMLYGKIWTLQPKIEWVEEIIQACRKANIPIFLKNNLLPIIQDRKLIQEMPQ